MNTRNLIHNDRMIRCTCGAEFEVRGSVLRDPEQLIEAKEAIAAKHACRKGPVRSSIRLFRQWDTGDLEAYWVGEMARLMPVQ